MPILTSSPQFYPSPWTTLLAHRCMLTHSSLCTCRVKRVPQPPGLVACFAPLFTSQSKSTERPGPATGRTRRAWVCYCRLWGGGVGCAIVTRLMFVYTGARIRLPIVSWERRFIDMGQSNDAGQGEVEVGSEGAGADRDEVKEEQLPARRLLQREAHRHHREQRRSAPREREQHRRHAR